MQSFETLIVRTQPFGMSISRVFPEGFCGPCAVIGGKCRFPCICILGACTVG